MNRNGSSRTTFFLVTGISFFIFGKMLQWLDGTPLPVLTWTGFIALLFALINCIISLTGRSEEK